MLTTRKKTKHSENVATPLCFGNISEGWSVDNLKKLDYMGMFMIIVLIIAILLLIIYILTII